MRHQLLQRIQRFLAIISFICLLTIGLIVAQRLGYQWPTVADLVPAGWLGPLWGRQLALVSGHAGNDSGAICIDDAGNPTVTEQAINAAIANLVAQQFARQGATVTILNEFDDRLQGLQADLLVSIHADSCIGASGYKAAYATNANVATAALVLNRCFDEWYAKTTQLTLHLNTITHAMTDYHAFRKIDPTTPAMILEVGFIGGDQQLLVERPATVAQGITESIRCYFESEQNRQ